MTEPAAAAAPRPMTPHDRLIQAVLYALTAGCFFPVPEPSPEASSRDWIQWGAMRNLHTAMADLTKAGSPGAPA